MLIRGIGSRLFQCFFSRVDVNSKESEMQFQVCLFARSFFPLYHPDEKGWRTYQLLMDRAMIRMMQELF